PRAKLRVEPRDMIEPLPRLAKQLLREFDLDPAQLRNARHEVDAIALVEVVELARGIAPGDHFRLHPSVGRVGDGEREVPVGGPDVLGFLRHHDVSGWAEQDVRVGSFRGEAIVFVHLLAAFQRAFEHYESMRIASKEGAVEAVEVDLDLRSEERRVGKEGRAGRGTDECRERTARGRYGTTVA